MRNSNTIVTGGEDSKIVITDYLDKDNPYVLTNLESYDNLTGSPNGIYSIC